MIAYEQDEQTLVMVRASIQRILADFPEDYLHPVILRGELVSALGKLGRIFDATIAHQELVIGVFGTTSSGKTTLLNGLMGHNLLPTDADELSAGVIAVRHRVGACRLKVHTAGDVPWHTGAFQCRGMEELRHRIAAIMHLYQEWTRLGRELPPPDVEVECDLRGAMRHFGLDGQGGVTLLDLPGLRTVEDGKNLPTIIDAARRCFPIVVLNYTHLFAVEQVESVLRLLSEHNVYVHAGVEPVVLLNKVDLVSTTDQPVANVATRVREICAASLDTSVRVIPFSALLFQATTAAARFVDRASSLEPWELNDRERTALLHVLEDALHAIRRLARLSRDDRRRLQRLEDDVDEQLAPSLDDILWFARTGFRASGALALREQIDDAVRSTQALRDETKISRAIDEAIARKLKSAGASRNACKALEKRQLRFVASLFQLMIEADGQVDPAEVELARTLLNEFQLRFTPSLTSDAATDALISSEHVSTCIDYVCNEAEAVPFKPDQLKWIRKSLKALMAVDGQFCEAEREILLLFSMIESAAA